MLALIARVKNLLLQPATEWDAIDREEVEPRRLALRYVAPLAAIPTLAIILALAVVGVQSGGEWVRAPILGVLLSALIFFVMTIVGVFAFAAIINWLAPRFGAARNYRQAFKLSAYSVTAALVAGVLAAAPALQVFALMASAYSLYLLFVGAGILLHRFPRQGRTGGVFARGIADHAGEIAYQKQHLVAKILKLAQFIDQYRVAQVQIRRRGVETGLDAQAPTGFQTIHQVLFQEYLFRPALNKRQGLVRQAHRDSNHSVSKGGCKVTTPNFGFKFA